MRTDAVPCIAALSVDKPGYGHFFVRTAFVLQDTLCLGANVEAGHHDTFLFGTAFVVLALDLQKSQVAVHVLPHADLLTHELPVVVAEVHIHVLCVVVHGVVGGYPLAVDLLRIVLLFRHFQNRRQNRNRHRIFGVNAIHQFNALHLA